MIRNNRGVSSFRNDCGVFRQCQNSLIFPCCKKALCYAQDAGLWPAVFLQVKADLLVGEGAGNIFSGVGEIKMNVRKSGDKGLSVFCALQQVRAEKLCEGTKTHSPQPLADQQDPRIFSLSGSPAAWPTAG